MLFAFCFFYEEDAFCFHDNDRKKYRRFALVLMVLINQTDSFLTSISITLGFIRFFFFIIIYIQVENSMFTLYFNVDIIFDDFF
jgi:hypothetical protein